MDKLPANGSTFLPGDNVTYRIDITNIGLGSAQNIKIKDVLQSNITHIGNIQILPGSNCSAVTIDATGGIEATFTIEGVLPTMKSCAFTYDAHIWEHQPDGIYPNIARLSYTDLANQPYPNVTSRTHIIIASSPGLFVVKTYTDFATCAQAGDIVNFTIEIRNAGDVILYDIDVEDTLPVGLIVVDAINNVVINGGTVNRTHMAGRDIEWTISEVPAQNTTTLWVTARVSDGAALGTLTNEVFATAHKPDGSEMYGGDTADVKICKPNIKWEKFSREQEPVTAGSLVTYRIYVENTGEGRAKNIKITDDLPRTDWTYYDPIGTINDSCGNNWTVIGSENVVTFTIDTFDGPSECDFDFRARVSEETPGPYTYTNRIYGTWDDANGNTTIGQDRIEATVTVIGAQGISINKEIYPRVVKHGDPIDYTITICNREPGNMTIDLEDYLVKGLEVTYCPWGPSTAPEIDADATVIPDLNTMSNSSDYSITNTLHATLTSGHNDTGSMDVNESVLWNATISNAANSEATMTNVGLVYNFGDCLNVTNVGVCTRNSDTQVTCSNIVDISAGGTDSRGITTEVICAGDQSGTPTVNYNALNAVGETNSCPSMTGNANSDCSITSTGTATITKTADVSHVQPDESITYTITIDNSNTNSNMTNVVLTDTLPTGFTCTGGNCGCVATGGCTIGNIGPNSSSVIQITALVDENANDSAYNNAQITYDATSSPTTNGPYTLTVSQETTVFKPDLEVWKTNDPRCDNFVEDEENVTYTIVITNDGGGDAINVTVRDIFVDKSVTVPDTNCTNCPGGICGNCNTTYTEENPLYHVTGVLSLKCTGNETPVTVTNTSVNSSEMNFTFSAIENGTKCTITYNVTVPKYTNTSDYDNNVTITEGKFLNGEDLTETEGINNTATSTVIVEGNYLHLCKGTVVLTEVGCKEYHIKAIVTEDMTDQEFTNTIKAKGTSSQGFTYYDESTVTGYVEDPHITIIKWADETAVAPGAIVTFYIQIQNPSETNLIDLNLTDILPQGFEYVTESSYLEGQKFMTQEPILFILQNHTQYLATGTVSSQTVTAFSDNSITLHATATVTEEITGKQWRIIDTVYNHSYVLINESTGLHVHDAELWEIFQVTPYTYNENTSDNQQNLTWRIKNLKAKTTKLLTFKAKVKCDIIKGDNANVNTACIEGTTHDNEIVGPLCTNFSMTGHLANMTLIKYANKHKVTWYDVVEYTIVIKNPIGKFDALSILEKLNDTMAPKLKFINNSATLNGALFNPNIIIGDHNNPNGTTLIWNGSPFNETALYPGTMAVLKYKVMVMPGTQSILDNNVTLDYLDPPMSGATTDASEYARFRTTNKHEIQRDIMTTTTNNVIVQSTEKTITQTDTNKETQTVTYIATGSTTTTDLSKETRLCVVPLKEGWNLISLPERPTEPENNTDDVLSNVKGKYTDIFTYDGTTWVYKSEYLGKWFGDLSEMNEGKGYWVKATEDCEIKYVCWDTEAKTNLKEGWNLIGPVLTSNGETAKSVESLGVDYTDVFGYDDNQWNYKSEYLGKWFGTLTEMNVTKGYWIKVDSDGTIVQY